jgi:hypothetical protein
VDFLLAMILPISLASISPQDHCGPMIGQATYALNPVFRRAVTLNRLHGLELVSQAGATMISVL